MYSCDMYCKKSVHNVTNQNTSKDLQQKQLLVMDPTPDILI